MEFPFPFPYSNLSRRGKEKLGKREVSKNISQLQKSVFSFSPSFSSRVYSDLNMEMEMETPKERGEDTGRHVTQLIALGASSVIAMAVTVLTQRRTVTAEGLHCVSTGLSTP